MRRQDITEMLWFMEVAQERSFTKAAAKLGTSQSNLSHAIKQLELRMGIRLLSRTTRNVSPTEAGERLLRTLVPHFSDIENEVVALMASQSRPSGTVRITLSDHALDWIVWPKLRPIVAAYPEIKLELNIDNGFTNIVEDRFDAGVRLGESLDKDMIAVRIGPDWRLIAVASPETQRNLEGTTLDAIIIGGEYEPRPDLFGAKFMADVFAPVATPALADEHNLTGNIQGLSSVIGIGSASSPILWESWFYESGNPAIRFKRRQELETLALTIEAARAGLGVAIVPYPHVAKDLEERRLVAPYGLTVRAGGYHFCCRKLDVELPRYRKMLSWLTQVAAPSAG